MREIAEVPGLPKLTDVIKDARHGIDEEMYEKYGESEFKRIQKFGNKIYYE